MSAGRLVRRMVPVTVLALLASCLVAPSFAGAAPPPAGPVVPAERSVPVTPVAGRTPPAPATDTLPAWSPGSPVWPAGGTGTVPVDTTAVGAAATAVGAAPAGSPGVGTVGGLPLRVRKQGPDPSDPRGAAKAAAAAAPASVRVSVAGQDVAAQAGITGVLFTLARGDGSTTPAEVALDVDYSGFATAYGGDFGGRLRLVRLPGCALSTPALPECHVPTPVVDAVNVTGSRVVSVNAADVAGADAGTFAAPAGKPGKAGSLTGDASSVVPAGSADPVSGSGSTAGSTPTSPAAGGPTVYAVTASASSPAGDYSHSSLSPTYSWAAGTQGGEFSYQLPLQMPPGLGGPVPDVTLRYSSGSVDGRTLSTSAQASWVGEGWDYTPGYIEQAYRNCKDDGATNTDLCWFSDKVYTMVFNGRSTRLVKDDTTGKWHGEADDGSRIELLTDTSLANGDRQGRYFKLTTLDGTQYFFGRTKRFAGDASQNSTQSVLVFGNNTGEPCHNATHDYWSGCEMNLRWYLDYVVDPRGNSMSYFYSKYGASYGDWNATDVWDYDLTVTLDHIEYGTRAGTETPNSAPMKVTFATGTRCLASLCADHPENWPDTPWDQFCPTWATSCSHPTATFWTPFYLASVTTWVRDPAISDYRKVDQWALTPSFPSTLDGSPSSLWFDWFAHTGFNAAGTSLAEPSMHFGGEALPNRVLDSGMAYQHVRLDWIGNGVGGVTTVVYNPAQCTEANIVGVPYDANYMRCYRQYDGAAGWYWYHKYTVHQVVEQDGTGGSPNEVWTYDYSTAGFNSNVLWHFDSNETAPNAQRSWSDFAGYSTVTTTHGTSGNPTSVTKTLYYRGMDGDRTATGDYTRSVSLTDPGDVWPATDQAPLRGFVKEEDTLDGTTVVAKTFHTANVVQTGQRTDTAGGRYMSTITANRVKEAGTGTSTWIAATGTWRSTGISYTYEPTYGLQTGTTDYGDISIPGDDVCTGIGYVTPDTTKWMINYPSSTMTTNCSPDFVTNLAGTQILYDGSTTVGATPTQGLPTRTNVLAETGWKQAGRSGYDSYGRVTDVWDALDRHSSTSYIPATGGPVTATTVTNPLGHVTTTALDPGRGAATTVVDPNGKTTTMQYDPLGRTTKVFKPHPTTTTGYTATTATTLFVDIAGTGTPVGLSGDDTHADLDLPFAFPFYNTSYTEASLSSNGLLSFTDTVEDSAPTGLPDSAPPNAVIAPFWADLVLDGSSSVVTATTGTAPNRQFTIEWVNATFYAEPTIDTSKRVTFTLTLSENGTITFNYTGISTNTTEQGATATVGIENQTGTTGTQYSHNQSVLATNKAVTLTPTTVPTVTLPDLEYTYTLRPSGGPNAVTTKRLGPNGNQITSYQLYDGRLRLRQTQSPAPQANGGRNIVDSAYDSRGLGVKTSTFWNSAAPTDTLAAFNDVDVLNQQRTAYDNLARQTSTALWSQNVMKWQAVTGYDGDRAWSIPPAGGTAAMILTDARGRTTQLRQYTAGIPPSATTYRTTSYGYDRLGRQTSVTDPDTNQWTTSYDLRGRVTAKTDPDTGSSTYSYDDAGQLLTATDARNISLSYSYDNLGRQTGLYDGVGTSGFQRAGWVYDTIAKGQLTSATRRVNTTDAYTIAATAYNDAYQPTGSKVTIPVVTGQPAGTYQVDTSYNVDGSTASIGYPAAGGLPAETISFGYDTTGRPLTLTGAVPYISGTSYYAFGAPYQQLHGTAGSRVRQTTTVDEATGRLTANTTDIETATNTFTQQLKELYSYSDAGNVTAINEVNASGGTVSQQCFTHDPLQELAEAWTTTAGACQTSPSQAVVGGPDPYWSSYTYTATGSRATETKHAATGDTLRTYLYPASGQRHTLTSVATTGATTGTDSYTYDATGNTTTRNIASRPGQTLTWDNEGHLATVTDSSGTSSYIYDADGNRLIAKDPAGVTAYLPGFELRKVGSTVAATRYYSTAARTPTGLTWLASDPHGTNQLAINATTLAITRRKSDPFGNARGADPTWPTPKGFVGGTRDSTGLTHLGAREYEPAAGRFTSADPILDTANPQAMGGYSYANNNPVTNSDPGGLRTCNGSIEDCGNDATNGNMGWGHGSTPGSSSPPPPPRKKPPNPVINESTVGDGLTLQIHEDGTATLNGWVIPDGVADPFAFANAVGKVWDATPPDGGYRLKRVIIATCQTANVCPPDLETNTIADMMYGVAVNNRDLCDDSCQTFQGMLAGLGGAIIGSEGPGMHAGGFGGTLLNEGRSFSGRAGRACVDSFDGQTHVLMADGHTKPIDQVKLGDKVRATDPATGQTTSRTVTVLHRHLDQELTDLALTDAAGNMIVLHTTPGHRFWDETQQRWADASALDIGDRLYTPNGMPAMVVGVLTFAGPKPMYNLTVDTAHTYYVIAGSTPVLVHNCVGSPRNAKGQYASGENPDAARGRLTHQNYRTALGDGYDYEFTLPSGRRPDAIDWDNHVVRELKSDAPSSQATGRRQLQDYVDELERITGEQWTGYLDTYSR